MKIVDKWKKDGTSYAEVFIDNQIGVIDNTPTGGNYTLRLSLAHDTTQGDRLFEFSHEQLSKLANTVLELNHHDYINARDALLDNVMYHLKTNNNLTSEEYRAHAAEFGKTPDQAGVVVPDWTVFFDTWDEVLERSSQGPGLNKPSA